MYGSVLRSKLSQNNVLQLGTEESFVKKKKKKFLQRSEFE